MYIPNSVDIECISTTLPQRVLHGSLLRGSRSCVVKPVGAGGVGGTNKAEDKASTGVGFVQHANL